MSDYSTTFIGPDGTLLTAFAARFFAVTNNLVLNANLACGFSAGAQVDQVGVTGNWSPNQFAEGTVGALGGVSYCGLSLRNGTPGSGNGYWWSGTVGVSYFGYNVAGVFTTLATVAAFAPTDFIRMEGDEGNINLLINGASVGIWADATYANGSPGLCGFRNDLASGMQDFRCGDLRPASVFMPLFLSGI